MKFNFPVGAAGRVYGPSDLSEHLAATHGALIVVTGRPRLPSLGINERSHRIIRFVGGAPTAGWGSIGGGADDVANGGALWLSFPSLGEAFAFARTHLSHLDVSVSK